MSTKPKVGVSSCLLGMPVRYNGDHKRYDWITKVLLRHIDVVGVCPETQMGLPTPRPALRLVQSGRSRRLVETNSKVDLTELAEITAANLASGFGDVDGFILKKDSPSCGLERVKVYSPHGMPSKTGVGIFAAALRDAYPLLPTIEEGRLGDLSQRENFLLRVYAFHEARQLLLQKKKLPMREVQRFHQQYKLVLLAHSPQLYRTLGKLVGNADKLSGHEILEAYLPKFMSALQKPPTLGNQINALQHAFGFLRDVAGEKARLQIIEAISEYQRGEVPFLVPLRLVFHEVRKFHLDYLIDQKFFAPFPRAVLGAEK